MQTVLIICTLAVGHALFWACILFNLNKKLSNKLLAVVLVMLALRVGKSVAGFVFPGNLYFFSAVGAVSMAEIGPLLFFFTQSFFNHSFKLGVRQYLQLVPGFLVIPGLLISQWLLLNLTYYFFTLHLLFYISLSAEYLLRRREIFKADDLKWKWITLVILAVAIISITFVLQLLFYQPLVYKLIVTTAAVLFYGLSWWAIPRSKIFIESRRKPDEGHIYDELGKRIQQLLKQEEIFTNPEMTVTKMASLVKAPPYLVSKALNHYFEKSFSELLTQHRIKKSEELLLADGSKMLTIEAIAYESGFNTLSAFYTAFKKINKVTPAQFRENTNQSKMRIA